MTLAERDSLIKLSWGELRRRIELAECIIMDAIRENVGETALKEVIRQRDVIKRTMKDKKILEKNSKKPEGIVIGMKPLKLTLFQTNRRK